MIFDKLRYIDNCIYNTVFLFFFKYMHWVQDHHSEDDMVFCTRGTKKDTFYNLKRQKPISENVI